MQERNSGQDIENLTFRISGAYYNEKCFPSLNDLLHEAERHPKAYNRMKQQFQMVAVNAIRHDLRGYKSSKVIIPHYTFGEPKKGKRRDYDNIVAAARKIVNDALTITGTIKDDNPTYLEYGTNEFVYTDGAPFIEVRLEEKNE